MCWRCMRPSGRTRWTTPRRSRSSAPTAPRGGDVVGHPGPVADPGAEPAAVTPLHPSVRAGPEGRGRQRLRPQPHGRHHGPELLGPGRGRLLQRAVPAAELAQDVAEDAAVAVVLDLVGGVDADLGAELLVVGADGDLLDPVAGAGALQAGDVVDHVAGVAEGAGGLAGRELEREDAHADQVGPVDTLEALGDRGADP